MIYAIFLHEIKSQVRNKIFWILLPLVLLLSALVAASHWQQQQLFAASQQHWQTANDNLWHSQPDRHPHRVAHYGSLAFRQISPLNFIDAGVDPYIGNALFLEAHRQNSANLKQFTFSAGNLRLGQLSIATIVLTLWPLVLIAIAYGAVSGEKERGTLKLALTLGTRLHHILIGKGLAYGAISALFLLFLFTIASGFIVASEVSLTDTWLRLGALLILYTLYSIIWIAIVLLVSSLAANNSQSLVALLTVWLVTVVLIPRAVPSAVEMIHPTPDRALFDIALTKSIAEVGDSHNPDDPHFNAFKNKMLEEYGVERVEDLPVNWRGVVMGEGERITSEVFKTHYGALLERFRRQTEIQTGASLISPFMAASLLSARLAGTDAETFYRFEEQAENFRYDMIQKLNDLQAREIDYHHNSTQRLSSDTWKQFDTFTFRPATISACLGQSISLIAYCLFWAVLMSVVYFALFKRRQVLL